MLGSIVTGLRKAMINLSENTMCLGRNTNPGLYEMFLGAVVPPCILYQPRLIFTIRQTHLYMSCMSGLYYALLHVSAVHCSHYKVGHWFVKRAKLERLPISNSKCKVTTKQLRILIFSTEMEE